MEFQFIFMPVSNLILQNKAHTSEVYRTFIYQYIYVFFHFRMSFSRFRRKVFKQFLFKSFQKWNLIH